MRTYNSTRNVFSALVMSVITIFIGLIAQRIFINTLGMEYLGINGLFTNIISMLGIIELGLGFAIIYHLYKPVATHDVAAIKSLIEFYKKGYRVIASVVTVMGILIMPFLGAIVGQVNIPPESIYIIYVLFLIDVVCSYLLIYKRSILYADQKNYIINSVHTGYVVIMNGLQIVTLIATGNYYLYLILRIVMRIIENITITVIVNKRYPYLNTGKTLPIDDITRQDIIKKIKALFIHKIGDFAVLGSDNIVISMFLGIKIVGLYSNYYLVISALLSIISQVFISITASIGNLLVDSNHKQSFNTYNRIRFANYWIASIAAVGFIVAMDSFVTVWLGNEYVLPISVLLTLGVNLYLQLMRSVTNSFKTAAGIFHEDRFVPIMESLINIVFSIIFLQFFGLAGVFMGTICSNLVLLLYSYPKYVYTRLFKRSYKDYYVEFIKYLVLALVAGTVTFAVSRMIAVDSMVIKFIINVILSTVIPSVIIYYVYRKSDEFTYFRALIKRIYIQMRLKSMKQR